MAIDKDKFNSLVAEYKKRDQFLADKKKEVEKALNERSEVMGQIAALIAPKKRFLLDGREVLIVRRGDTVFIRGAKEDIFDPNKDEE